jgi:hypothetical protein
MTLLTQKLSKLHFAAVIRVALALVIVAFATSATLAQTNQQVSFSATGTAVITGVTKLPGGLTQLNATVSGNATHLGDLTGSATYPGQSGELWHH